MFAEIIFEFMDFLSISAMYLEPVSNFLALHLVRDLSFPPWSRELSHFSLRFGTTQMNNRMESSIFSFNRH